MNAKNIIITGAALLLTVFAVNAKRGFHPAPTMVVKGQVVHDGMPLNNVKINIYAEGRLVRTIDDLEKGEFKFDLSLHRDFLIEFQSDGMITKTAAVNSHIPGTVKRVPAYEMQIDLKSNKPGADLSALEMPFYIIEFDRYQRKFIYHAGHTVDMMLAELEVLKN